MDRATSTQSADVSRIIAKSFSSWVIHRKPGLLSYSVCKRTACSDPVKAGKIPTPFFCVFARSEKRTFLKASVAQSVSLASTQGISPFVETSFTGFWQRQFQPACTGVLSALCQGLHCWAAGYYPCSQSEDPFMLSGILRLSYKWESGPLYNSHGPFGPITDYQQMNWHTVRRPFYVLSIQYHKHSLSSYWRLSLGKYVLRQFLKCILFLFYKYSFRAVSDLLMFGSF